MKKLTRVSTALRHDQHLLDGDSHYPLPWRDDLLRIKCWKCGDDQSLQEAYVYFNGERTIYQCRACDNWMIHVSDDQKDPEKNGIPGGKYSFWLTADLDISAVAKLALEILDAAPLEAFMGFGNGPVVINRVGNA